MFEVPMFVWVFVSVGYFIWAISKLIMAIGESRDQAGYREDSKARAKETVQQTRINDERWALEKEGLLKKKKK